MGRVGIYGEEGNSVRIKGEYLRYWINIWIASALKSASEFFLMRGAYCVGVE